MSRLIRQHVYEMLPWRDHGIREYLVRDDGSPVRGRFRGGNIAAEACEELARASGYRVWFRDVLFLGIPGSPRGLPRVYPYTIDLTGHAQERGEGEDVMVWVDDEQMRALGEWSNRDIGWYQPATLVLYERVRAVLQARQEGGGHA